MNTLSGSWLLSFYLIFSFPVILYLLTGILFRFYSSPPKKDKKRILYLNSVSVIVWVLLIFFIEFLLPVILKGIYE